jgi:phage-related protein
MGDDKGRKGIFNSVAAVISINAMAVQPSSTNTVKSLAQELSKEVKTPGRSILSRVEVASEKREDIQMEVARPVEASRSGV